MKREAREQEAGTGRPPAAMLTGWSRAARSRRAPGGLGGTQLRAELRDPPTPRSPVLGSGALRVGAGEGVQGSGAHCQGRAEQRTPKSKPPPGSSPPGPGVRGPQGQLPAGGRGPPPTAPHCPLCPAPGPAARSPHRRPGEAGPGPPRPLPAWALPAKEVKRQRRLPAANSSRLLKTPRWKRAWGRAAGVGVGAWGADAHGHRLPPARVRAGENKDLWVP